MRKEQVKILIDKLKLYIQYCEQSEKRAERRMNMPIGSRKGIRGGRLTTVGAKWANCAEARDRIEKEVRALITNLDNY